MEQSWPILTQLAPSGGYLGTLFGLAWGYLVLLGAILSNLGTILNPNPKFNDSFTFLMVLGSIWSHLGIHFGSHFGTKSAQEEPKWAQEDHQEPQSTENLHLQKP